MNPFGKVRPGDTLNIPASVYNDFLDIRAWFRSRGNSTTKGEGSVYDRTTHVEFVCDADNNLSIGQAVWLEEPVETISPPDAGELDHATRRFVARPLFQGKKVTGWEVTVGGETLKRQLGIVTGMQNRASGAQKGRIGVACVAGCTIAYMKEKASGQWIQPGDGGNVYADTGYAQVVWPQDEADRDDNEHLAFVRFTGSAADTDCPEYDCGLAVGAALPRTTSTGVLRMFRGQRPNTDAALSTTNRPEKELQIGVGFLGRWTGTKTARWMMPGLPPNSASQPDPNVITYNENSISSNQPELRRHLVTRRHTQNKNAIEFDFSPPGFQGWLYVLGTQFPTVTGSDPFTSISSSNPQHLALRIYDGLVVAGRWFPHNNSSAMSWNATNAAEAIASEIDPGSQTYFDGGCCPKYDAAASLDIYQGPGGFH